MGKTYRRDGRRGAMVWIVAVLIMIGQSIQADPYPDCPECKRPNPDFDPDNSYETDDECIPCCEGKKCTDNDLGCGCCKEGDCWHPAEDCPNPPLLELDLFKVGDCPWCKKAIMGCQGPSPKTPTFNLDTCFKACNWKVGSGTITAYYYEGLCPEKCQENINSADDVDINNYCDVLKKLKAEIKETEDWLDDPPIASEVGDWDGTVEPFCFGNCLSQHEAQHTQQLYNELMKEGSDLLAELDKISVPFDCGDAKTAEGAADAMKGDIYKTIKDQYKDFLEDWDNDDLAKEQEKDAHQKSLECMQDLLKEIEDKAKLNNWKCP